MSEITINPNKVTGAPTKALFISMLTRDISLRDAIGDLVDNAVDGIKKLTQTPSDYEKYKIIIDLSENAFVINDNCGGIDIETARNYAFRIGRSPEYEGTPYSVGQFGIGMKRALFKIAKKFEVHSKTETSSFVLSVDVNEWESKSNEWDFYFEKFEENINVPENERGTKIIVSELTKEAKSEFSDANFIKNIQIELEKENMYPISKGLKILLNQTPLKIRDMGFIISKEIKSGYETFIEPIGSGNVDVKIYAGISESKLSDGGWYIFCNGRMILGPERTAITGWGAGRDSEGIPVYHNQYDRFRGYVYFESENPSLLPWNTTKNGVDIDSPLFKFIRQRMIQMAKPIITFLNRVHDERKNDTKESEWFLANKMSDANTTFISIKDIDNSLETYTAKVFQSPVVPKVKSGESEIKISYKKPKSQVDKVKKSLGTANNKELGELTFQYYFDREIDE